MQRVGRLEHGRARHKDICSCADQLSGILVSHSPVDFDQEVCAFACSKVSKAAHLVEGAGNELLPPKTGIDTHQTDKVEIVTHFLEDMDGGVWIQCHTGPHAGLLDGVQGAVQMGAGFRVHRQDMGTECREVADVTVGGLDHEVDVHRLVRMTSDGFDDGHAEADVGDEHAVHHIDMMPVRLAGLDHLNIPGEVSEICSQERRSDEVTHGAKMAFPAGMPEYCNMPLSTAHTGQGHAPPLVIGLTGGIGTGKSTVSGILRSLGYGVYDADAAAKSLYATDEALRRDIRSHFGDVVFHTDGTLDRKAMAQKVFGDAMALAELNALVHPAVARDFEAWMKVMEGMGSSVVFREAAILFESGSNKGCDRVWMVAAPIELRIRRVRARDGLSVEAIRERMSHQWPAEKVASMADAVLVNDEMAPLMPQLMTLLEEL